MISAKGQYTPRGDLGRFVSVKISPAVKAGVEEWSKGVFQISQDLVPVDTGELKASGEILPVEETGKTVTCGVQYTAAHAGYVEFGTGIRGAVSPGAGKGPCSSTWPGMVAQPYLRPAYEEMREKAQAIVQDAISVTMS